MSFRKYSLSVTLLSIYNQKDLYIQDICIYSTVYLKYFATINLAIRSLCLPIRIQKNSVGNEIKYKFLLAAWRCLPFHNYCASDLSYRIISRLNTFSPTTTPTSTSMSSGCELRSQRGAGPVCVSNVWPGRAVVIAIVLRRRRANFYL